MQSKFRADKNCNTLHFTNTTHFKLIFLNYLQAKKFYRVLE